MLHECVERVPENVDAAKELLKYGLKGTDLEALIAIGDGEDRGRCVMHTYTDLQICISPLWLYVNQDVSSIDSSYQVI